MDWQIVWRKPLLLETTNGLYGVDLETIPEEPGIYIFLRSFGNNEEALYVGKAVRLKGRIRSQLNNHKLMKAVESAPKGARQLVYGVLQKKRGKQSGDPLVVIERGLIKHYLSLGHSLVNIHGTNISRHSLLSERLSLKQFIPRELFFERAH